MKTPTTFPLGPTDHEKFVEAAEHLAELLNITPIKLRLMISNTRKMAKGFKRHQLWTLVSYMTGHGSGYSIMICKKLNLDPYQLCGDELRCVKPNRN